jgi:hypothetical protein
MDEEDKKLICTSRKIIHQLNRRISFSEHELKDIVLNNKIIEFFLTFSKRCCITNKYTINKESFELIEKVYFRFGN